MRTKILTSVLITLIACGPSARADSESDVIYKRDVQPFLQKHCYKCHDARRARAGLRLDNLGTDFLAGRNADVWREVIDKINLGEMPPKSEPRPDPRAGFAVVEWVGHQLKRAERRARMAGGRILLRRLNRREYANTVGDLFQLDPNFVAKLKEELPADGKAEGFDRISTALFFDKGQLQKYLEVTDLIAREVIQSAPPTSSEVVWEAERFRRGSKQKVPTYQGAKHLIPLGADFYKVRDDGFETWNGRPVRDKKGWVLIPPGPGIGLTQLVRQDGYYRIRVHGGAFPGERGEPIRLLFAYARGTPLENEYFLTVRGTLKDPEVSETFVFLRAGQDGQKLSMSIRWNGLHDVRIRNPKHNKLSIRRLQYTGKIQKAVAAGRREEAAEWRAKLNEVLKELNAFTGPEYIHNDKYDLAKVPRLFLDRITVEGPFVGVNKANLASSPKSRTLVWQPERQMEMPDKKVSYANLSGVKKHRVDAGPPALSRRGPGVEWIHGVDVREDENENSPWMRLAWHVPDLREIVTKDGQYRIKVVVRAIPGKRKEPVRLRLYYADRTPVQRRVDFTIPPGRRLQVLNKVLYLRKGKGDGQRKLVPYWNPIRDLIEDTPEHRKHLAATIGVVEKIEEALAKKAPPAEIDRLRKQLTANRQAAAKFRGPIRRINPTYKVKEAPRLFVDRIEIEGPLPGAWPPKSHTVLGIDDVVPESTAAIRTLFTRLLPKAYRRPVSPGEIDTLVQIVMEGREKHGLSSVDALRMGLQTMLCSPGFVFIQEPQTKDGARKPRRINDYELASRLSYFLWSSMPDDTLFSLASKNKLGEASVLRAQVKRMLADPRSRRFVNGFAGQWLTVDQFGTVMPARQYSDYDKDLEEASREEPLAFFEHILSKDLPITNFVDSDFLVINERLARHYGIKGVKRPAFRRVAIRPEHHRGGILGMAGLLTLLSDGTRTLPVRRAAWVLENLLNDPPAPPPPNAGEIQPNTRGKKLTVRQRLALHRKEPTCASCHAKLDGYGLALENYDAIGAWRTKQNGEGFRGPNAPPIDASGVLKSGRKFKDLEGFKAALLQEKEKFARAFAIKMLTYALGRPVGYVDRKTIDPLTDALKQDDYRIQALIQAIVTSEPFQTK